MPTLKTTPSSSPAVKIFYTRFYEKENFHELFEREISTMPPLIQKQILSYHKTQDRIASLLGKLLLRSALEHFSVGSLSELRYTRHSKPYLDKLKFSISHSHEYVVCAVSNFCIPGIDIEMVRPVPVEEFRSEMRSEEWERIINSKNIQQEFYRFWTQKECILKADGRGLGVPLQHLTITHMKAELSGKTWYIQEIPIANNYLLYIATDIFQAPLELIAKTYS